MAERNIVDGYPLSLYVVDGSPLPEASRRLAEELLLVFRRKRTAAKFAKDNNVVKLQPALEALLDRTEGLAAPAKPDVLREFRSRLQTLLSGTTGDAEQVAALVGNAFLGYAHIQPLLEDEALEEIMVNGVGSPVLVFHSLHGPCRTSISFNDEREVNEFVGQITGGSAEVFSDSRMVDGSRANVVRPPASASPIVTIRKYRAQALSIVDLLRSGTINLDAAAFLWVAIDGLQLYPFNVMVVGPTACGKTTTLSALTAFFPPTERVVLMEDTPEIHVEGRDDWVGMMSSPQARLDELVKNSLRMRPDRLLVGEVRGPEATSLFTAMNVGHRGVLSTLHADSARDAVNRLTRPPMLIPADWIPLVDILVVQHRLYDRRKGLLRRVTQISEVSKVEDVVALNDVFRYNVESDELSRTELSSQTRDRLAKACSVTGDRIDRTVAERKKLLHYLLEKGVRTPEAVLAFMRQFYSQSDRLH